jgi:hypothetical protein
MSFWDSLGNLAKFYKDAYSKDTGPNNNIGFGQANDIATSLPSNPGGWNDAVESARKKGVDVATVAMSKTIGVPLTYLDKKTDGLSTKVLSMAPKNVRSNYAFVRDVTAQNASMGMLSALGMIGGGVLGAIGGFAVGNIPGAVAGFGLGTAAAGKLQREISQTDLVESINKDLSKSAKFAESAVGQEQYNFGNDVVHSAAAITGYKTIGDNTKGVGAITSGLLNFGFETMVGPDILTAKLGGAAARKSLIAPVVQKRTGLIAGRKVFDKFDARQEAIRAADDIDVLKKTAAGETTKYTPLFEFFKNNDAATIAKRPEFQNEIGAKAASLLSGESNQTIATILRIGRGDKQALEELTALRADKVMQIERLEGAMKVKEIDGIPTLSHVGINAKKSAAEVAAMRKQTQWLDDALQLDTRLTDRTVARSARVERYRNDIAKNKIERGLSGKNGIEKGLRTTRETKLGSTIQSLYQNNSLGKLVRFVDRFADDTPHQTINFNDAIQSTDRMRTNIRSAVKVEAFSADDALSTYNKFVNARTEAEKFNIVEAHNTQVVQQIAAKYNVSPLIADEVIEIYNKTNRKMVQNSKSAKELQQNYMVNPHAPDELISDPQLITQLANGSHVIDVMEVDKAFKRFSEKGMSESNILQKGSVGAKFVTDEFLGIWRGLTLARVGYPLNILRDTTLRMYGDAALFEAYKDFSQETIKTLANSNNTVSKIKDWIAGSVNPKTNIKNIRSNIDERLTTIKVLEKRINGSGYDFNNPPKIVDNDVAIAIAQRDELMATVNELRRQEAALIASKGLPTKVVKADTITISGYTFPAARSGRLGEISLAKLSGKEDIRRALASSRELEIANATRGRSGSRSITPAENESLHLQSWEQVLNDKLRYDDVARQIMSGASKKEVTDWLKAPENFQYLDRFGLTTRDSGTVYERVLATVDAFAPSPELQKLVISDGVDINALKKLYPDINERPTVLTDLADDMLGTSNAYQMGKDYLKNTVAWMSTAPTSKLAYAPYFSVKYQQKLQSMVAVANANGRVLSAREMVNFEKAARDYAMSQYKNKLNSFHRDMNYTGLINYAIAFFPAVVEQFRAYGRIAYDHPEFLVKAAQITTLPDRIGTVQEDQYGEKYIEVDMPFVNMKGRISTDWLNPINPTGGAILSAGPVAAFGTNLAAQKLHIENRFTERVLPFGVQANAFQALTPNTVKRFSQLFSAGVLGNKGGQFNKDTNMFLIQRHKDFIDKYNREPRSSELNKMEKGAADDALSLSILRFVSSTILPTQPRYVTPITAYADILGKYRNKYGIDADEKFSQDYPEYFLLSTSLSDSTSGINADMTAVELVRKNSDVVKNISSLISPDNMTVLGSIFNDDNYAFSRAAQTWLETSNIPGQAKTFKNATSALDATRSNIVSKGWNDWNKLITIVTNEMDRAGYSVAKGYGKAVLDSYKERYLAGQKNLNPIWWKEKTANPTIAMGKETDTVAALTIAMNTPKLWSELAKQPRWHTIAEYMNLRYDVNAALTQMGTSIGSQQATGLRNNVLTMVEEMKKKDIKFGAFYERYFSNDTFSYIYEGE